MHPNAKLITRFYTSLQQTDFESLAKCYAPDALYSDPVFRKLRGDRALAMWQMICERSQDMKVEFSDVSADDTTGSGRWTARYTFSKTGRLVENFIDSRFRFAGGLICEQRDTFDVHRWAGMALGPFGRLLGWTPPVHAVLHRQASRLIDDFVAERHAS